MPPAPTATCPSGKRPYPSSERALRCAKAIALRTSREVRVYRCEHRGCGAWHVASERRRHPEGAGKP